MANSVSYRHTRLKTNNTASSCTNIFPFFFPFAFCIPDGVPIVFSAGFSTRDYRQLLCHCEGSGTLNSLSAFWYFSLASCFWVGFLGIFFFLGLDGARLGCTMMVTTEKMIGKNFASSGDWSLILRVAIFGRIFHISSLCPLHFLSMASNISNSCAFL